jgi:hypothetical protein
MTPARPTPLSAAVDPGRRPEILRAATQPRLSHGQPCPAPEESR